MDSSLSTTSSVLHISYIAPEKEVLSSVSHNVSQNETEQETSTRMRDVHLVRIEIAVQAAIFCLAVIGNALVLLILRMKPSKLSRMNIMIVHLSVADLFVAFCNVLPQLIWDITGTFEGGDILCRVVKYIQVVAMYASSYVLLSTAIDRWKVICHPLKSHTWTNRKLHTMVGVAWFVSLIFALPQTFIFSLQEMAPGKYQCWANWTPWWTLQLYISWFAIAVYIVPSVLLVLAYGKICYEVWSSMRNKETANIPVKHTSHENGRLLLTTNSSGPRAHVRGLSRAKVKTVKLTLTVIVCYLVCWGPFFTAQMWAAWDINAPFEGDVMVVIMLLASLNSCVNPWIYFAFSADLCGHRHRRAHPPAHNANRHCSTGNIYATKRTQNAAQQRSTVIEQFTI